jgi:hypothetical protein
MFDAQSIVRLPASGPRDDAFGGVPEKSGLLEYGPEKTTLVADDATRLLGVGHRSQTLGISEGLVAVFLVKRE